MNRSPFWVDNSTAPPAELVKREGCNCAGLINLIRRKLNLSIPGVEFKLYYAGGTYVWFEYLKYFNFIDNLDLDSEYPIGTLLIRKYRSLEDQGHLAILLTTGRLLDQKVLHCYPEKGIQIDDKVSLSHYWLPNGYYEYICKPDYWLHYLK